MKSSRLNLAFVGSLVGVCMALGACETQNIKTRSQTDPSANLSSYHTYGFVAEPGTNRSGYSTPITSYFKNAITREMNARGYTLSDTNPDLLINFNTNAREQVDIRSTPSMSYGVGYGYGYYGYRGGMYAAGPIGGTEVETVRYKQGTANIDVVDAAKKQLVWEGVAEGKITDKMMKNPQATIDGVITEMFAQYPVKGGVAPAPAK
jgi:outer membrane scaffolding protein for murein synthesis (MipA/OmpV family)